MLAGEVNAQGSAQRREFNPRTFGFSVAERDRRWAAVRAVMARPSWNLDAVVTAASDLPGNTARYLTQIGMRMGGGDGAEVIFPRDPARAVYIQVGGTRFRDFWKAKAAGWMADGKLTVSAEGGAQTLAKQMAAQGLDRPGARIGVAKLAGSRFEPEGLVAATWFDKLKAALPGVVFVPIDQWGTDAGPVEESARIKGAEEQAVIRQAVAASEHGVAAMIAAIRAGAGKQGELWFATYTAMFARTGEDPTRVSISFDEPANALIGEPADDPLRTGQIVNEEIDATVQGYRAQVNHAVFVGGPATPGYDYYRAAFDIAATLIKEVPATIVPGKTTLGEFLKRHSARVEELGADDASTVMFHSSGIGNLSRPRVGPKSGVEEFEIVLQPGMTFDYKPAVRVKRATLADVGAQNREINVGEHFLLTTEGAVRLGAREIVPIATQG
jgi:Xaa-Pro aminopeptidase